MNTHRYYYWFALAAILVVAGLWFYTRQNDPETPGLRTGTETGQSLPAVYLLTFDGDELTMNDLNGKLLVFNAFASWCGPCRVETPDLVKFYQANRDQVLLIGLNIGEDETAISSYQKDFAVPYPLVIDPDGKLAELFRPRGLPTSWFVDREGIVRMIHVGPLTVESIEKIIKEMQ